MKNRKLIEAFFRQKSDGIAPVVALITGLAVGAVLGVLFAPASGKDARDKICDAALRFRGSVSVEEEVVENDLRPPVAHKKPKSDIKSIIHDAHVAHTEQGLS
ncbi:YtxH domain-containing protein [Pedobacter frigoris]|uniref:YtxH domain-containing protein n=1 Tax=Pedobacter frigoris TaxID=2571272 RepID=A0A4U1CHX7_9SPHI|nr:YtxH domain-containing protein [Pedobacter frigoris]TKC06217.1 YtxH domain-containing protein [Pedobacter frigoris]